MLSDLEQLIHLQGLENAVSAARATLEELPGRFEALDTRMAQAEEQLSNATNRLGDHKTARQVQEKELAEVQSRLSRFREQLMAVKTNKEYQAMQLEIAGGEREVQRLEDGVLERMLEADELTSEVRAAEQRLAEEKTAVERERAALERERGEVEQRITKLEAERDERAGSLPPSVRSLFETVSRHRNGVAVVEARDGRCSSCQVRLRPQLYNDVRLNNTLIQCESCHRILYFEGNPSVPNAGAAG